MKCIQNDFLLFWDFVFKLVFVQDSPLGNSGCQPRTTVVIFVICVFWHRTLHIVLYDIDSVANFCVSAIWLPISLDQTNIVHDVCSWRLWTFGVTIGHRPSPLSASLVQPYYIDLRVLFEHPPKDPINIDRPVTREFSTLFQSWTFFLGIALDLWSEPSCSWWLAPRRVRRENCLNCSMFISQNSFVRLHSLFSCFHFFFILPPCLLNKYMIF